MKTAPAQNSPKTREGQGDDPNQRRYRNTFGRPEPVGALIEESINPRHLVPEVMLHLLLVRRTQGHDFIPWLCSG